MDLREPQRFFRSVVYYLERGGQSPLRAIGEQLSNSRQWSHIAPGSLRDFVPKIGFLGKKEGPSLGGAFETNVDRID
jgi:hypothetical protein